MAADLLQKRPSPTISPEQFAEETRQILENFLQRHHSRPEIPEFLSSGSVASDGVGHDNIFVLGAPMTGLRKRKIAPKWRHPFFHNYSHHSAPCRYNDSKATASETGQVDLRDAHQSLSIGEEPSDKIRTGAASCSSSQDSDEARLTRGFDAEQSSSSSAKEDKDRPRMKKSAFKRAKERLRRSILRKTPLPNASKKKRMVSRNSSSFMNGNHLVKEPVPAVQRSTSVGGSGQPAVTNGGTQQKRRRFLERLRSLGRSAKQELPPPARRPPDAPPKKQRPRDFPKSFRQLGESLTSLRERIGASPLRRRKRFVDFPDSNVVDDHLVTSSMSINVQRPSCSSASHENNASDIPLSPSTALATLSLAVNASQSSSQKSSQVSRQHSVDSDVYAQIAARLAQLGDEYVFSAIEAARLQQEEFAGCAVNKKTEELTDLERDVISWVESTSIQDLSRPEGLEDLTQASSSREFGLAIDRAVRQRTRAPATQLALVFHFTSAAIRAVGATSMAAQQIGEYCISYVGNRFADWLIGQGGWLSVVEDSSNSNSEID